MSAAPRAAEDRLRSAGVHVTTFSCGRAALLHWDESGERFDAAVIDEAAPGLSGQTLTLALRASGYRGALIGLADDPRSHSASRWCERGCDVVVPKDGTRGEGLAWLAALLSRPASPLPEVLATNGGTPEAGHAGRNGR